MSSVYVGRVCEKHPELGGQRRKGSTTCLGCEKEKRNAIKAKARRDELRESVVSHYGGKCRCCGETDIDVLCMDHINGGGEQHRKEIPASRLYRWLRDNNYPDAFRVLCLNCNFRSHLSMLRTGKPLENKHGV